MEDDLDALLESALEDFTRDAKTPAPPSPAIPTPQTPINTNENNNNQPTPTTPTTPNDPSNDIFSSLFQNLGSDANNFAGLTKMLEDDKLREEFESEMQKFMESFASGNFSDELAKLAQLNLNDLSATNSENNNNNNTNTNKEENNENKPPLNANENSPFAKALDSLFQQAKEVEDKQGEKSDEGDLLNMMNDPNLMDAVQKLADKFLSKDVLADVMADLHEQYKEWLEKNGPTASPEDFQRFTEQIRCIEDIMDLYKKTDEPDEKEVSDLLMRFQSLGSLPDEMLNKNNTCSVM